MSESLLAEADRLYGLGLAEFTGARDARAKELKATDVDLAAAVKALRKPTLAAWVLNAFVRAESVQVDGLIDVGEALRAAQAAMSADDLRALTKQRRQLTASLTTAARVNARRLGVAVTAAVGDQVEASLTAAMVDAEAASALRSGLLIGALTTTGLGDLDAAASLALPEALGFEASPVERPSAGLRLVADPDADAKARAAQREQAQSAWEEARVRHQESLAEHEELQARSLQLHAEVDELRRRLADLEADAEDLDDALEQAAEACEFTAADLAEAEENLRSLS